MYKTIYAIIAASLTLFLASCSSGSTRTYADLVIEGRIFTAENDSSYATAIAVKNGKIIALDEDALNEKGEGTNVIKTEGLVLPGFIDCHSHGAAGLRLGQLVKMSERESITDGTNPFHKEDSSDSLKIEMIMSYQKMMAANGITAFQDACTNFENFDLVNLYEQLDNEGKIYIHTFGSYKINLENISDIDSISSLSTAFKGGNFELNTIKVYLDRQPFADISDDGDDFEESDTEKRPCFTADDIIPSRKLSKIISSANNGNLNVAAHAFTPDAVKTFAEYASIKASDKSRNSLIHINSIDDKCIDAITGSTVAVIVNPFWFSTQTMKMDSSLTALNAQNPERVYPLKDFIDKNVPAAVGIDYPSSQSLSFAKAIYHMVARKHPGAPDSTSLSSCQAISAATAIRCATAGGAYMLGKENSYGTLSIGKEADIVILDKDIISCTTEEIPSAEVLYTIIAGKVLFQRSDPVR